MPKSKIVRALLICIALVAVLVVGLALALFLPFTRMAPPTDGARLPGGATLVVSGGSNVYIMPSEIGRVVLVDCGGDPRMTAVAAALKKMGLGLKSVAAVLITHAHPDHIAGCLALPSAEYYSEAAEIPYIEGSAVLSNPLSSLFPSAPKPTGIHIAHGLEDGEAGHLGDLGVVGFLVPGHTPGSAAYLINNVVYAGDAAAFDRSGKLVSSPWIFNSDGEMAANSIHALARRLAGEKIELVATGHTAPGSFAALK